MTTQLLLRMQAVTNAKAYQVQYHNGTATWQELGIFPNTRGIRLTALTPGSVYTVRARAVGGSTQYSEWSDPISLMAT